MYSLQLLLLAILHPLLFLFTSSGSVTVGKTGEFWTWALELAGQWTWLQVKELKCIFIVC